MARMSSSETNAARTRTGSGAASRHPKDPVQGRYSELPSEALPPVMSAYESSTFARVNRLGHDELAECGSPPISRGMRTPLARKPSPALVRALILDPPPTRVLNLYPHVVTIADLNTTLNRPPRP
jgi:hypothetical protein